MPGRRNRADPDAQTFLPLCPPYAATLLFLFNSLNPPSPHPLVPLPTRARVPLNHLTPRPFFRFQSSAQQQRTPFYFHSTLPPAPHRSLFHSFCLRVSVPLCCFTLPLAKRSFFAVLFLFVIFFFFYVLVLFTVAPERESFFQSLYKVFLLL